MKGNQGGFFFFFFCHGGNNSKDSDSLWRQDTNREGLVVFPAESSPLQSHVQLDGVCLGL